LFFEAADNEGVKRRMHSDVFITGVEVLVG
jgi:hypothetical protein